MLQKIDGKLAVMGNTHTSGDEMGKALSSSNFQSLGPKPAQPAVKPQAAVGLTPAPANTDASTKS